MQPPKRPAVASAFGQQLQDWRSIRGKSQLALALEAGVSPRHVSFIETGRSKPSREMVLTLASVLNLPLREQNVLLVAAGHAPIYHEARLDAVELAPARRALELILEHQEPYPAVVMDRRWDVVITNGAATRLFELLLGQRMSAAQGPANVLRLMLHPDGVRPHVNNWEAVAEALIQRVHHEALRGLLDEVTNRLLEEVLSYPGVPPRWRRRDPALPLTPLVPVAFQKDGLSLRFFSTVTTLGTPQDVTLQELRVECFFPADAETEAQAHALLETAATP